MWGESLTQQPLCAEPVLSSYQMKLKNPISSLLVTQRGCLGRDVPSQGGGIDGSQGSSGAECRVLERLSTLTPLLPFCISLQDNQELRTTKHPATRLCQEPSPALHVSAGSSCPLFLLLPVRWQSPKCLSRRSKNGREGVVSGEREKQMSRKMQWAMIQDGMRSCWAVNGFRFLITALALMAALTSSASQ